jgi:hypothetical protein
MANVTMPQPAAKKDRLGSMMQIGAMIPGPQQPILAGIGAVRNMNDKPKAEVPMAQASGGSAMQRRMQSLESQQLNVAQLRDAESALAYLPPEQAQQYGPAIKKARTFAEQEIA